MLHWAMRTAGGRLLRLMRFGWPGGRLCSSSARWLRPSGAISVDESRRILTVSWPTSASTAPSAAPDRDADAVSVLPLAWLRDACQCPSCFSAAAQARLLSFDELDPRVPVSSACLNADSTQLTVEWQDGHRSSFARSWLQERSFTLGARQRRESRLLFNRREKTWGERLEEFAFQEIMQDDASLLKLLRHLDARGCLLVKAAPSELPTLAEFASRLAGFLSPSNYGHTFEVKSKVNPSSAAYTSGFLGLHVDQCFYHRRPGVQLLHCISQPKDGSIQGGESLLSDGFLAARMLKRRSPEHFRALATLPVDFNDCGTDFVGEFYLLNRETVLRLDSAGEVDRVTFSGHSRDYSQNHLPPEQVQLLFDALKAFYEILNQAPCLVEHKMETGDIQLTDNRRVLHGRRAYSVANGAERFLHGGFAEWDEIYSRMRRLEAAGGGGASQ